MGVDCIDCTVCKNNVVTDVGRKCGHCSDFVCQHCFKDNNVTFVCYDCGAQTLNKMPEGKCECGYEWSRYCDLMICKKCMNHELRKDDYSKLVEHLHKKYKFDLDAECKEADIEYFDSVFEVDQVSGSKRRRKSRSESSSSFDEKEAAVVDELYTHILLLKTHLINK